VGRKIGCGRAEFGGAALKVLLTGASGFLGQHVLKQLLEQGLEVIILGRSLPVGAHCCVWHKVDFLTPDSLAEALVKTKATHLLHLAWCTEHNAYWQSPLNLKWVDASIRLLQAFSNSGGRHAVMVGSCAEYDWSHGYLRETTSPLAPASLYGVAKDATRRLAEAWGMSENMSLAWAHVFYPFGPGEARERMLPSLIEVFRGRAPAFGVNIGAYRGLLPVQDAARALVHLLMQECTGRFNVCSGQPVTIETVVRDLAKLCGADPTPVLSLASARPGDPHFLVGDNQRLLSTGWQPLHTLQEGLELQLSQSL